MRRSPVFGLILAGMLSASPGRAAAGADYLGTFVWTGDRPDFGGWSGFDTDAQGVAFRAVSDIGRTVAGRLVRDAAGRVTGVEAGPNDPLLGDEAEILAVYVRDAEGLAVAPDGSFAVSFEGDDRIGRIVTYATPQSRAVILMNGQGLGLDENKGIEALAMAADGALYGITEGAGLLTGHRGFVLRNGALSEPFALPRDGTWRPVGADFGPDGRLYLLERDFWPFLGFQSRVLRLTLAADGNAVTGTEVLLETHAGVHDNLEGIAVWTDAAGGTRLTMISDDNLRRSQRTEIVDYRLTD